MMIGYVAAAAIAADCTAYLSTPALVNKTPGSHSSLGRISSSHPDISSILNPSRLINFGRLCAGQMECNTVGNTNSDIAGLGVSLHYPNYLLAPANNKVQIIYAFVIQGGLSVVLSILSVSLEYYQVSAKTKPRLFGTAGSLEKWINCTNAILSDISQIQIINGKKLHFMVNRYPSYADDIHS